jgi:nitroreductase
VVVENRELVEKLAETVYVSSNVLGAPLVVVLVSRSALDGGRAAQNMMLAAWNEGVVSCPNGMPDPARTGALLGLGGDEPPLLVLTFGYPARGRDPERRSPAEWSRRADRKPLAELVTRI